MTDMRGFACWKAFSLLEEEVSFYRFQTRGYEDGKDGVLGNTV